MAVAELPCQSRRGLLVLVVAPARLVTRHLVDGCYTLLLWRVERLRDLRALRHFVHEQRRDYHVDHEDAVEQAVNEEERVDRRLGRREEAHLEGRDYRREDERQGGDAVPHVHAGRGGVDDVAGLVLQLLVHLGDLCCISQRIHAHCIHFAQLVHCALIGRHFSCRFPLPAELFLRESSGVVATDPLDDIVLRSSSRHLLEGALESHTAGRPFGRRLIGSARRHRQRCACLPTTRTLYVGPKTTLSRDKRNALRSFTWGGRATPICSEVGTLRG
eukprot:scaffold31888_cov52-Phaeocystis_antarctica.AAC.3